VSTAPPDYRLKLDRARKHLEDLDHLIERMKEFHDKVIGADPQADEARYVRQDDLLLCGLIVGDLMHNARSSLDALVYAIADKWTKGPLSEEDAGSLQFPVSLNKGAFDKQLGKHVLRGLPPGAKAIIEKLQPYNRSGTAERNALYKLNRISNMDKHRRITVATPGRNLSVTISPGSPNSGVRFSHASERGAKVHRDPHSATKMHMDRDFAFGVQIVNPDELWDSEWIDDLSGQVIDYIETTVVGRLVQFV